jgi:hypothetical protein
MSWYFAHMTQNYDVILLTHAQEFAQRSQSKMAQKSTPQYPSSPNGGSSQEEEGEESAR